MTQTSQIHSESKIFVFVGSHATGPNIGITVFDFDDETGALTNPRLACEAVAPAFMVIPENGNLLYTCNSLESMNNVKEGGLTAFKINKDNGSLMAINQKQSGGANPCYISLDKTNRFAFVANYNSGSIAAYNILNDGSLGSQTVFFQYSGKGIHPKRQDRAHAHCIKADPSNQFVLATDLGTDRLMVYQFDHHNGSLVPHNPAFITQKNGAGPRHFAFHPNTKWLYLSNELDNTVSAFTWDSKNGRLTEIQNIPALPPDYKEENTLAEIQVHPNGRFLYCSNRGHNSIAIFKIDESAGNLQFIEHIPAIGEAPRNFEIAPSGKWMIVASHNSNNLTVFSVDDNNGHLSQAGPVIKVADSPYNVRFLEVKK